MSSKNAPRPSPPVTRSADQPTAPASHTPPPNLDELIALAFETAAGVVPSKALLVAAARRFGADRALVVLWAAGEPPGMALATHNLEVARVRNWFDQRNDPESLFGQLAGQQGPSVVLREVPERARQGWPAAQLLAGVISPMDNAHCALVLLRDAGKAAFNARQGDELQALLPFLERSARVNQHFVRYQQAYLAAETIIDKALRAILVLGENGDVVYRNQEAQRILDSGDGLSLDESRLVIADADAQRRCSEYIAQVREQKRSGQDPGDNEGCGIRVKRGADRTAYQLVLYPLPNAHQQSALDGYLGVIAAVVHDPDQIVGLSQEVLQRFFRLTPAESSLAGTLLRLHRLPDVARELGISVNTARTHLKSIFQKMGVNSQAALVQRLSQTLEIEPRGTSRKRGGAKR